MHRLFRTLRSRSDDSDKGKKIARIPQRDDSPLAKLPYEVIENILIFAWHGDPTGLPGGGTFVFNDPRAELTDQYADHSLSGASDPANSGQETTRTALATEDESSHQIQLPPLIPAPHTRLTTSAWAVRNGAGVFRGTEEYRRLALVCNTWREIMLDVTKIYVSLPSLKKMQEYAKLLQVDVSRDEVLARLKDAQHGKEWSKGNTDDEDALTLSKCAEKARRLCRSLHVDIPTGNLTMVPSWYDIPTITAPLTSLTHLMLTAAEPHPALFTLLASLPSTLTMLDIHISSPFAYKPVIVGSSAPMSTAATMTQTLAEMSRREIQRRNMESLRMGVSNVKHLLINVIDPILLGNLLEGFGSMEPSTSVAVAATPSGKDDATKEGPANRASSSIYASRALQTVTLQGMYDLTCREITQTISHSSTIHTLRLYPHSNLLPFSPSEDSARWWNAVRALENEAWFPALEKLVVAMPAGYIAQSKELKRIREACRKRGVIVDVESCLWSLHT